MPDRISVLRRLKSLIGGVEAPVIESIRPPVNRDQDNTRVEKSLKVFEVIGYRKITARLPKFFPVTLPGFLSGEFEKIDPKKINSMTFADMRFLFRNDTGLIEFTCQFNEESKQPLQKECPYLIYENALRGVDLRSPNMKLIDEHIVELLKEIERVKDVNRRTKKDKLQNRNLLVGFLYYGSWGTPYHIPIRRVVEGVNDHGFDSNSFELIQVEINAGRIEPFPLVRDKRTETTKQIPQK